MFGEEVEEEVKPKVTVIPSSTDAPTSVIQASTIAIDSNSATLTTEALRVLLRVLDQPEELTTLLPVKTTNQQTTTEQPTTTDFVHNTETPAQASTTSIHVSTTSAQDSSSFAHPSTSLSQESSVSAVSSEAFVAQATTVEPSSSFVIFSQEATRPTGPPPSPTTQATNYFDNIFPTAFDKLLTTLKDFVAQAEAATSTEAPKPATTVSAPQLEKKVEFVNFTVSEEQHNDESKVIVKRSIPAVDLIPRYYKHLSIKEKGCAFNGRSFKVGEIIKTDNDCLKCICEYAPIGHCVLKEKCNSLK